MANSKKHIRFKIHFNLTTKPECVRTKVTELLQHPQRHFIPSSPDW